MAVSKMKRPDNSLGSIPHDIVLRVAYDANSVDASVFIADADYEVSKVTGVPRVAGSDGSAVTLAVKKCTTTQAPSSGTAVHSSTYNLKGTADTVQTLTLSTTQSERQLTSGDRLALDFTGTLTAAVGMIQINLKRIVGAGSDF